MHVLLYSELVAGTEQELTRLLDFLSVSVTKEEMECAMKRKEGIYRRKKKRLKTGSVFDGYLTNIVNERKDRVLKLVKQKL